MMNPYLSLKLRRLSLASMVAVVFVHAFNFEDRYLWFGRIFDEKLDLNSFVQLLISNGLLRFGLPLFFLRSGYLMAYSDEKYSPLERIKKKSKTLLAPYLAWSAIGILITWALEASPFRPFVESSWLGPFNNQRIENLDGLQMLEVWALNPISFQLWFLRSLFIYACLYPLLKKGIQKFPIPLLVVSFLMWMLSIGLFIVEGEGLFFFLLGISLQIHYKKIISDSSWIDKTGALYWTPVLALVKTYFSFSSHPLDWHFLMLMYKLLQIGLILSIWRAYDLIFKGSIQSNLWDRISPYTFFVYGLHVPVMYYLTDYLHFTFGRSLETSLAIYFLLPFSLMGFSVLLGWFLQKTMKPVFLVLTGFRTV